MEARGNRRGRGGRGRGGARGKGGWMVAGRGGRALAPAAAAAEAHQPLEVDDGGGFASEAVRELLLDGDSTASSPDGADPAASSSGSPSSPCREGGGEAFQEAVAAVAAALAKQQRAEERAAKWKETQLRVRTRARTVLASLAPFDAAARLGGGGSVLVVGGEGGPSGPSWSARAVRAALWHLRNGVDALLSFSARTEATERPPAPPAADWREWSPWELKAATSLLTESAVAAAAEARLAQLEGRPPRSAALSVAVVHDVPPRFLPPERRGAAPKNRWAGEWDPWVLKETQTLALGAMANGATLLVTAPVPTRVGSALPAFRYLVVLPQGMNDDEAAAAGELGFVQMPRQLWCEVLWQARKDQLREEAAAEPSGKAGTAVKPSGKTLRRPAVHAIVVDLHEALAAMPLTSQTAPQVAEAKAAVAAGRNAGMKALDKLRDATHQTLDSNHAQVDVVDPLNFVDFPPPGVYAWTMADEMPAATGARTFSVGAPSTYAAPIAAAGYGAAVVLHAALQDGAEGRWRRVHDGASHSSPAAFPLEVHGDGTEAEPQLDGDGAKVKPPQLVVSTAHQASLGAGDHPIGSDQTGAHLIDGRGGRG